MEWWLTLIIIIGGLVFLMSFGMPVAFCFMLISVIGSFLLMRGEVGLIQLGLSMFSSVANFNFIPIPLFILMGEILFHSGIGPKMVDAIDKLLGSIPGRLAIIAVAAGALFASLTGSSLSSTALLGETLVPEMEKRGYKKAMSLGPILGSGGIAIMIPPSALAVYLAAVGEISIGRTLLGIIVPGILMAILYTAYIIIACWLKPSLAAPYAIDAVSASAKGKAVLKTVVPVGVIIFFVTGVIFFGIATPSEAAATGAGAMFLLAFIYGKLDWKAIKKIFVSTMQVTGMLFLIIATAKIYSQVLAYSGASSGLMKFASELEVQPIFVAASLIGIVLFLGMFMTGSALIMIVVPLGVPLMRKIGFDPIWFAVVVMLGVEMGGTTPPFGAILFSLKGVAPPDTTIEDCYKASLPFLGCDLIVMILLFIFPQLALWLPSAVTR